MRHPRSGLECLLLHSAWVRYILVVVRQVIRTGLVASAGTFAFALLICSVDLWLEPAREGRLYVFGVTARDGGHHSIAVRPAVLLWCFAVPMVLTILAGYRRHRRQQVGQP
jgi:hypothetical protein